MPSLRPKNSNFLFVFLSTVVDIIFILIFIFILIIVYSCMHLYAFVCFFKDIKAFRDVHKKSGRRAIMPHGRVSVCICLKA